MDKGKCFIAVLVVLVIVLMFFLAWSIVSLKSALVPDNGGRIGSIGLGFKTVNDSAILGSMHHADNGNFSGFITVEPSADCLLMALVDYRVVPFYFDGRYNTTHYLSDSLSGQYSGVFSVTNMSEGFHDVLIIGLVSPYNYSSDPWSVSAVSGWLRFNVIVGNATKPSVSFENRSTAVNTVYSSDNGYSSRLSKSPFDNRMLLKEALKPGATLDYYVNVGHGIVNGEILNTSLAIVQMMDYRQIPVRYNTTADVYYGYIDRAENCSVHMSFKAPETMGLHRLINIVVTDPYACFEIAPGAINTGITQSATFEHVDIVIVK